MKIFKYSLFCHSVPESVQLPKGAQVISADVQHSNIVFWALVDPNGKYNDNRKFLLAMTGQEIQGKVVKVFNTFTDGATGLVFTFMEVD